MPLSLFDLEGAGPRGGARGAAVTWQAAVAPGTGPAGGPVCGAAGHMAFAASVQQAIEEARWVSRAHGVGSGATALSAVTGTRRCDTRDDSWRWRGMRTLSRSGDRHRRYPL
jgi:hypothetical protein